jgi:hypothetical protein
LCVFWAQFLTQSDEDRFILEEPIMTADKVVIIMASKTHLERARQYGMGRAVILDATHGTCVYGITLSTAHVVDDHGHCLSLSRGSREFGIVPVDYRKHSTVQCP